jgi:hypothetical protein
MLDLPLATFTYQLIQIAKSGQQKILKIKIKLFIGHSLLL